MSQSRKIQLILAIILVNCNCLKFPKILRKSMIFLANFRWYKREDSFKVRRHKKTYTRRIKMDKSQQVIYQKINKVQDPLIIQTRQQIKEIKNQQNNRFKTYQKAYLIMKCITRMTRTKKSVIHLRAKATILTNLEYNQMERVSLQLLCFYLLKATKIFS